MHYYQAGERALLVDIEVIVRRQDQEHCASITCMIRHYVARRAQVTEGHPHNARDSRSGRLDCTWLMRSRCRWVLSVVDDQQSLRAHVRSRRPRRWRRSRPGRQRSPGR